MVLFRVAVLGLAFTPGCAFACMSPARITLRLAGTKCGRAREDLPRFTRAKARA